MVIRRRWGHTWLDDPMLKVEALAAGALVLSGVVGEGKKLADAQVELIDARLIEVVRREHTVAPFGHRLGERGVAALRGEGEEVAEIRAPVSRARASTMPPTPPDAPSTSRCLLSSRLAALTHSFAVMASMGNAAQQDETPWRV